MEVYEFKPNELYETYGVLTKTCNKYTLWKEKGKGEVTTSDVHRSLQNPGNHIGGLKELHWSSGHVAK